MKIEDVAKLHIPAEFGCDEECEETNSMRDVFNQLHYEDRTAWGASKFVIFCEDNKVAKIPFNGSYYYVDHYDDNNYEDDYEEIFEEFYHYSDYCEREAGIYENAVELGVAFFFASTEYVGLTVNGTPYYVSEQVYDFYGEESHIITSSEKSRLKAKTYKTELDKIWLAQAIEFYGESAVEDLLAFIDLENISDLHIGNLGYRKDGSPCILDYSGYWG